MAKARTLLSTSSSDAHAELASQHAAAWNSQSSERLDPKCDLTSLRPSPNNPRRRSLDRAGVTHEKITELARRDGEGLDSWLDRLDDFCESLRMSDPVAATTWSELIDISVSISTSELLQPIVANKEGIIIAGERRWWASLLASIPVNRVFIREMSSVTETVSRFIENVLRSDLSLPEMISGLRAVLAEVTGEPCGPDNSKITIKQVRSLVGKGTTQSAHYRAFCRLPEDDPILQKLMVGAYSDKEVAYSDASKRLDELRREKAGIQTKTTSIPANDESCADPSDTSSESTDKSNERTTPDPKEAQSALMAKLPPLRTRLPGTGGGKAFLHAVESIPDLPVKIIEQIATVKNEWEPAGDKTRRKMLQSLLNKVFDELDALDVAGSIDSQEDDQ
ncbi:MAG: ParB/RepB/Spo0J family partition protein [Halopseudomonas sabulinigri]